MNLHRINIIVYDTRLKFFFVHQLLTDAAQSAASIGKRGIQLYLQYYFTDEEHLNSSYRRLIGTIYSISKFSAKSYCHGSRQKFDMPFVTVLQIYIN